MCGILGYLNSVSHHDTERADFKTALNMIAHRGPDHEGIFISEDQTVYFGHRRLSILDLSEGANQPMISDTGHVLIFNGEIYNYMDLKKALISKGYVFKTSSDTEVVLNAYLEYGEACLNKLNGIFALAMYHPETRHVLLARDPLGVKPLYFCQEGGVFIFGSELKSVLRLRKTSPVWHRSALIEYLMFLYTPSPHTLIDGVFKMKPGERLIVKDGRIQDQSIFLSVKDYTASSLESKPITESVLYEAFRKSVKRQLVSDVPVGAFLSGGVDSSAICHVALREMQGKSLPCFTIQFKGENSFDGFALDYPYARRFADENNIELHTVDTTPETLLKHLDHMIYHMDEPCPDPAALNVDLIAKLAREQDIKVLLSGSGGDDVFSGYRRHLLSVVDPLKYVPKRVRDVMQYVLQRIPSEHAWVRRGRRYLNATASGESARVMDFFAWHPLSAVQSLLNPDFLNQCPYSVEESTFVKALDALPKGMSMLRKMLFLDQTYFLADHNLNYMDKMGMAHGVEIRVPFLDLDLVKLSWTIPDSQLVKGTSLKFMFKNSLKTHVPDYILNRPKSGFGAPLRKWIRQDLRMEIDSVLSEARLDSWEIFNGGAVKRLIDLDRSGKMDASYLIFAIFILKKWEEAFFHG